MPDPDPRIAFSPLCCTASLDGITVEVQIFRLEDDPQWMLEVVNETGGSTVWDDQFDTDTEALAAFEQVAIEEGMKTFLDDGDIETLH